MLPKNNDDTELTCDVPAAGKADANFDLKSPDLPTTARLPPPAPNTGRAAFQPADLSPKH